MTARTTLRDLRSELEQVERERASVAEKISELDQLIAHLQGAIDHFAAIAEEQEMQPPAKTIRNEMAEILKAERRPLHYGELLNRLEQRQIAVKGKDPLRLVAAHLSNDQRFKSVGSGFWGLRSWPESLLRIEVSGPRPDAPAPANRSSLEPIPLRDRVREGRPGLQASPEPDDSDPDDESLKLAMDELGDLEIAEMKRLQATGSGFDDVPF